MTVRIVKFVGLGAITTCASYSTYLFLLQFWSAMASYWCALAVAFAIQTVMMAPFVFSAKLSLKNAGKSLTIYAGYSAIFAALMWLALNLSIPEIWAPLFVIAAACPLQFIAGKKWIHNPADEIRS